MTYHLIRTRAKPYEVVESVKSWLSLPNNSRWLMIYDNYDTLTFLVWRILPLWLSESSFLNHIKDQLSLQRGYRRLESVIPSGSKARKCRWWSSDFVKRIETTRVDKGKGRRGFNVTFLTLNARSRYCKAHKGIGWTSSCISYCWSIPRSNHEGFLRLSSFVLGVIGKAQGDKSWAKLVQRPNALFDMANLIWQYQTDEPVIGNLLSLSAYFDNQDLWFELLQYSNSDDPKWIRKLTKDDLSFNRAVRVLSNHRLVEITPSWQDWIESKRYSIHRCVYSSTIHALNQ
jgi:hypothetical protein